MNRPKTYNQYRKKAKRSVKASQMPKSQAKAVKAVVKAEMAKVIELKHADYQFEPFAFNALYHNVFSTIETDPFNINQGVQDAEAVNPPNRLGDSIYAKSIHFKMLFTMFGDRPNQAIRIIILKVKPDTPAILNPVLHPQAVSNIVSQVDTESSRYKALVYDKVFTMNNNVIVTGGTALRDTKFYWEHTVKVNKKINYEDGNVSARNFTYNIFVCAYDTQGSLTTDNIARYSYSRRTYYTDA